MRLRPKQAGLSPLLTGDGASAPLWGDAALCRPLSSPTTLDPPAPLSRPHCPRPPSSPPPADSPMHYTATFMSKADRIRQERPTAAPDVTYRCARGREAVFWGAGPGQAGPIVCCGGPQPTLPFSVLCISGERAWRWGEGPAPPCPPASLAPQGARMPACLGAGGVAPESPPPCHGVPRLLSPLPLAPLPPLASCL